MFEPRSSGRRLALRPSARWVGWWVWAWLALWWLAGAGVAAAGTPRVIRVDEAPDGFLLVGGGGGVLAAAGASGGARGWGAAGGGRRSGERAARGRLRIVTLNANSWATLRSQLVLLAESADVVLAQETKISGGKVRQEQAWLKRNGWSGVFADAIAGPQGGASSGVAVLVRRHVQVTDVDATVFAGRAVRGTIRGKDIGELDLYSAYAKDSLGMAGCNEDLYGAIADQIASRARPAIVGGDHNMPPEDLMPYWRTRELDIVLAAPRRATCRSSQSEAVLDYYLLTRLVGQVVREPYTWEGIPVSPHVPVVLDLDLAMAAVPVLVWRRPAFGGPARVMGPMPSVDLSPCEQLLRDFEASRRGWADCRLPKNWTMRRSARPRA